MIEGNPFISNREQKECTASQRSDLLELTASGQKVSLVDLSDERMVELLKQADNDTIAEAYQAFATREEMGAALGQ